MSWSWYSQLTDSFKRRAGRYLINRYLGPFLEEGILLDQLTVDGCIKLRNVAINTDHINSTLDQTEAPIEFVDGFIQELAVTVPWSNLLSENCFFEIRGLTITCQVKKRANPSQLSASIFHSMCESFSSKDMAEDCLRQNDITDSPSKSSIPAPAQCPDETVLGVEVLAQAIDSIIMRVQVAFIDTTFRIEYVPTIAPRGLALEIKVGSLKYSGEAVGGDDMKPAQMTSSTVKKIFFENVTLLTDEFSFQKGEDNVDRSSSSEDGTSNDDEDEALERRDTSKSSHEDELKPLILASLPGVQELVLRFVDTDHFGLPRSVEEVEFNLGSCVLHAYPHQIHAVIEILTAFTAASNGSNQDMPKDCINERPFMDNPNLRMGLETMLQESMYHKPSLGLETHGGWSTGNDEIISQSTEFQPMPRVSKKTAGMDSSSVQAEKTVTPAIKVKARNLIAVLIEKDEGVSKMGGESSKALAFEKMLQVAGSFFEIDFPSVIGVWDHERQARFHGIMEATCKESRLQMIGAPFSITYEEGSTQDSTFGAGFLMKLIMSFGRFSVREVIEAQPGSPYPSCKVDVVKFTDSSSADVKLIYEELPDDEGGFKRKTKSSVKLQLSPCAVAFDPGFVDRTYMQMFFSEMDPTCLVTPAINLLHDDENVIAPSLSVSVTCPQLDLDFFVPKVDMRKATDLSPEEFVSSFWARKVHPELFQMRMKAFEMQLTQESGPTSPLSIAFNCDFLDIQFQESESSDKLPLCIVRKSSRNLEMGHKRAARISITVCMDDSQKLQGRFDSSERAKTKMFSLEASTTDQFFTGAAGLSGDARQGGFNRGNRIVEEQLNIKAALDHSLSHNNIMVDISFDEVSIVLPNKHVYEVIYNRLGNDMLLWLPAIFSVKDVLYNQPLINPLTDPDQEFAHCISGNRTSSNLAIENQSEEMTGSIYGAFPKSKVPGSILIHTDTCVSLSLNRGHVTVSAPSKGDEDTTVYFFVGEIDKLKLLTAVGLERDPEMCLLSLNVHDARVAFGPSLGVHDSSSHDFVSKLHFNEFPSPKVQPLFRSSDFKSRVWPTSFDKELIRLTTKILFDSKTNFKTITLALFLCEGSVVVGSPTLQSVLIDWLSEYFTVVEYPVMGYIPPAIMTEMHFDVRHSTVDITFLTPGQISFTMGHVKVNCSLLDTGTDVNITISAEDLGLFISRNETAVSHLKSSICILDIDSLDTTVNLHEKSKVVLDVGLAVQLMRIRTCNDALMLLASFAASGIIPEAASSRGNSVPREEAQETYEVSSDVVPDLADAMAELEMEAEATKQKEAENEKLHKGKSKVAKTKTGSQVFFFPDENAKLQVLEQMGMTESIYVQQYHQDPVSDDDFCILDDVGSGFGTKPLEPSVIILDPSGTVSMFENHFALARDKANSAIDYLKTPKGFPQFQAKITLKHLSILWQLYGGKDFEQAVHGSVCSSSKKASDPGSNTVEGLKCRGGPGRRTDQLIEIFLSKISAQHELYPDDCREASRQILMINNFEVRDKLESSDINKLLHLYSNKLRPRQSNANMFGIKCVNLRPDPDLPKAEESVINVNLQPLRVNIDQETLFFIIDFCSDFLPNSKESLQPSQPLQTNAPIRYSHGMDTLEIQPDEIAAEADEDRSEEDVMEGNEGEDALQPVVHGVRTEDALYIRSFTFARDVPIRIDYSAKYMDLAHGAIAGILAGLTSLNCSELTLKKVHYRNGISGLDKLLTLLVTEWLADIRQNQIPTILGGVGPMHAFLQLIQGIKDLFMMPVEQYQKDGRILRGIQRGAHSFSSSTAMSLLDFTNKLLGVIKFAAEMAFDIMSPESSVVLGKLPHPSINRNALRRPADMREGMFNALAIIQEGMEETARTVMQNVIEDHNRRGLTGAVGGIIRQVPSNLVRPVILATSATTNVLEGMKNQVAPDARKEEEEKWKNAQT